MLRHAHFGKMGGKRKFAALANLMGLTAEADLQRRQQRNNSARRAEKFGALRTR
jgi:hypothetical protein